MYFGTAELKKKLISSRNAVFLRDVPSHVMAMLGDISAV